MKSDYQHGLPKSDIVTGCKEAMCDNAALERNEKEQELSSNSEEDVSLAELKRQIANRKSVQAHQTSA